MFNYKRPYKIQQFQQSIAPTITPNIYPISPTPFFITTLPTNNNATDTNTNNNTADTVTIDKLTKQLNYLSNELYTVRTEIELIRKDYESYKEDIAAINSNNIKNFLGIVNSTLVMDIENLKQKILVLEQQR